MPALVLAELGVETVIKRSKFGSFKLMQLAEQALDPRTELLGDVWFVRCTVCNLQVAGGFADVIAVIWAVDYKPEVSGSHCVVAKA